MKKQLLLIAGTTLLISSCKQSKFKGYEESDRGLYYKFFVKNDTTITPQVGDGIAIQYIIKKQSNDSTIVNSSDVSRDGSGIAKFLLQAPTFHGSIEDGILMMHKGDSASFIISADSFFLKTNKMNELPNFIRPGEYLNIYMKLVDIKTRKELEENQRKQEEELAKLKEEELKKLDDYILKNKITVKPTNSGLYYIELKKGSGEKITPNSVVKVHYRGELTDGTLFDTSEGKDPIEFTVGTGEVIPGWDEALQMMQKGTKAKIIVPSSLAYGKQQAGPIPPYSTLVFTLEVISVTPPVAGK
ncbi:MAG TPA: FKBP-type peptidyl-prolyl cis-trans isomerase [Bacteroidia bacterium]|jgi:FKBP-type peptidyl-prolyl cis-trans isomerase|nr:FKBP-type peptidyl-prolyl cis-trans isomerase [Bacteroidia bacterium]